MYYKHCVRIVQMRSFFWSIFSCIWTRKISVFTNFIQPLKAITSILMLKVNNRDARKRCEICSKLTIKTPEQRHWRRSGVFIGNFEYISQVLLVLLLLNLNI